MIHLPFCSLDSQLYTSCRTSALGSFRLRQLDGVSDRPHPSSTRARVPAWTQKIHGLGDPSLIRCAYSMASWDFADAAEAHEGRAIRWLRAYSSDLVEKVSAVDEIGVAAEGN